MTMKRKYFLLLFIVILLSTSGCSVILRKNYPAVKTLPTGWSRVQSGRRAVEFQNYEFQYKDVSARLSAQYFPAIRLTWFGPPLIPFIPKFLISPKDIFGKLDFNITIESPTDTSGLEISQIEVFGAGEKPLRVDIKSVFLRFDSEKPQELREIPKQPMISKGNLLLYLECHSNLAELKRFTIDLGSLKVGEEKIKLPPLNFQKKSQYLYWPFVYSNHLEDHYP